MQVPERIFSLKDLTYLERLLLAYFYSKNTNEIMFIFDVEKLSESLGESVLSICKAINILGDDYNDFLKYEFSAKLPYYEKGQGLEVIISVNYKKIQNL